MDPSIYHRFFEVEDRHWWFVGRRAVVEVLLERAMGRPAGSGGAAPGAANPAVSGATTSAAAGLTTPAAPGPAPATRASQPATPRILDVGCGTGGMLPLLSRYGAVTGIDSEPMALEYCRRRGISDLHLQEGFRADGAYDLVTLFDVLEHVPDEAGFLAWIRGLLKPGGRLVITVPAFQWLWSRHDVLNHHQRRYTRGRLWAALRGSGFAVERSSYFNFWLFPAAVAARLADGLARGGQSSGTVDRAAEAEEILKPLRIGAGNGLLTSVFSSEAGLVRAVDLPWGVSVGAVARRVEGPGDP